MPTGRSKTPRKTKKKTKPTPKPVRAVEGAHSAFSKANKKAVNTNPRSKKADAAAKKALKVYQARGGWKGLRKARTQGKK